MTEASDLQAVLAGGQNFKRFCTDILGLRLNPAQERWAEVVTADGDWACKGAVWVSANQVGKTLGVAALILWATVYKIGTDRSDPQTWLDAPYQWFHVAPSQQQAYIPLKDIVLLVKGAHPAQVNPCRFPAQLVVFEKHEQYYDGFTVLTGGIAQFRTTEDKAKALQGRRANGISFDEAAFELHLKAVINETLLMRLISTGGPLLIVSTPNGINEYYEVVEQVRDEGKPVGLEGNVWVTDDGWALVWSTVLDNAGYGLSVDEIERMERDLDPATKEQQLRGEFIAPSEAFFTPKPDIEKAWKPEYTEQPPKPGHRYVIFWDPSVASDPTAAYVLDVTKDPWRVVHETWERKPGGISSLLNSIFGLHARYSADAAAITGYDETSMGGAIIGQQLVNLRPKRGINFGGNTKTKLDILINLRAALGSGRLVIPESMIGLKREVLNYRLDDKKIVQDRVMALAGATWIAARGFSGVTRAKFDPSSAVAPRWR